MKFRTPSLKPEPENIEDSGHAHSENYKLKVITPIYGGGVMAGQPDKEMPIRATAIRGQLRYWWRFLNMNGKNAITDKEKLFEKEREIWGGMGDEGQAEKDFSSKVFIKVTDCDKAQIKPCCEYNGQNINSPNFLPGIPQYALFPGQGKPPSAKDYNPETDKPHKIILSGLTFEFRIFANDNLSQADWDCVKESVRWWICFGGIGARTRRGLGSLKILDDGGFKTLDEMEVAKYGCELQTLKAYTASEAWNKAIGKLQRFRQTGVGRIGMGRSKWPEPDSIREITKLNTRQHQPTHPARIAFPRAAFGLPIIFKFKDDRGREPDPSQTELRPTHSERMASPLILKAMVTDDGEYQAIALRLPVKQQNSLVLELKGVPNKPAELPDEKEKEWDDNDWQQWPDNWWQSSKAGDVPPINDHDGKNALSAFMNFFTVRED